MSCAQTSGPENNAGVRSRRAEWGLLAVLVLALGWFYAWTARSNGAEWDLGAEQDDYYNQLIDGWLDGQLHMKVPVQPEMLALKDPYDPQQRPPGVGLHDTSFYKGKYYMYFGTAPVVVLMLPFRVITGVDLPRAAAALVFTFGGFLASVAVWRGIRRRYFPETGSVIMAMCVLVLGLAGLGPMLLRRPHVWEVPIGAGYCFAMLTLWCVWRSLDAEEQAAARARKRRRWWFAAAGLMLGLAVASRPTYLLATPLLALPLWRWWRDENAWPLREAIGAAAPLAIIGSLLALHNYLRFGNPLEFGQAYQLSLDYESKMDHFNPAYIGFNAWRYFFSAAEWSRYFPFIHPADLPPKPAGFGGHDDVYGVLRNMPFAWLALAAPLALWRRGVAERARLATWLGGAAVLFAVMAGVLLCFFGSLARYQVDFTPTLMLLATVGLLGIERALREVNARVVRFAVRTVCGATAVVSMVFGVLFSLQLDGLMRQRNPAGEREVARVLNRVPAIFETLRGVKHGAVEMTLELRPHDSGEHVLLTVGDAPPGDRVFVRYLSEARVQFGVVRGGAPEIVSRPLPVKFGHAYRLRVTLGSLFPPATHPFFTDQSAADVNRITRRMRIEFDGESIVDELRRFGGTNGVLRIGADAQVDPTQRFDGVIREARRTATRDVALPAGAGGFVRMRVSLPARPTAPREPLFSVGGPNGATVVYVHFLDESGRVSFGTSTGGERGQESSPFAVDLARVHEITVRWLPAEDAERRQVELRLDGTILFSRAVAWLPHQAALVAGKNVSGEPGCAKEFSGGIHQVQRSADARDPLIGPGDTIRLRVQLPRGRTGEREPLIVTGQNGGGDLLVVEYVDARSVRFLLDHWGSGPAVSEPVSVDFTQPLAFDITMTSLAPPEDVSVEPHVHYGEAAVAVNGLKCWTHETQLFTAEAEEFAIGRNAIGGTGCAPFFTGHVLAAERVVR